MVFLLTRFIYVVFFLFSSRFELFLVSCCLCFVSFVLLFVFFLFVALFVAVASLKRCTLILCDTVRPPTKGQPSPADQWSQNKVGKHKKK